MMLTHVCPRRGKEHEQPTTPEPNKLCEECKKKRWWDA
jgi:hypothetical protein